METVELLNKHKDKLISIVVILVALYFASGIYKKQAKALVSLNEQKETEIKKNQVLEGLSRSKEKYEQYKTSINKKEISALINTLSNIAAASSAKIVSIRPVPEQDLQTYVKYCFDLRIETNGYNALGKFISNLEGNNNIFNVESATISKSEDLQKNEFKLIAAIRLSTILLKN